MSDLDGAAVLDRVADFIGKYVVFPSEFCLPAVVLWAAHTFAVESFYVTPRLIADSAEAGSGKTRLLEALYLVTYRPKMSISTTTAALYRRLSEGIYTVLLDETDALFGKNATPQAEELRALLNSGYKKGATVDRCVGEGKKIVVQEFKVFAPVALAGIAGAMPATITTRAVTIHMRKRASDEQVEPFEEQDAAEEAKPIHRDLSAWMGSRAEGLKRSRPTPPPGVVDRPAEVWRALLAVAEAAGGDWPKRAEAACVHFVLGTTRQSRVSLGVRLLGDLRDVFGARDRMPTAEILEKLHAIDDAPWADLFGKPLDGARMAKELDRYDVGPVAYKDPTNRTVKGYTTYAVNTKSAQSAGLADAWRRYLGSPKPGASDEPE